MTRLASDSWVFWGANAGEWFIILFLTAAVVSARWWPRAGEAVARWLSGGPPRSRTKRPSDGPDDD